MTQCKILRNGYFIMFSCYFVFVIVIRYYLVWKLLDMIPLYCALYYIEFSCNRVHIPDCHSFIHYTWPTKSISTYIGGEGRGGGWMSLQVRRRRGVKEGLRKFAKIGREHLQKFKTDSPPLFFCKRFQILTKKLLSAFLPMVFFCLFYFFFLSLYFDFIFMSILVLFILWSIPPALLFFAFFFLEGNT